MLHVPNLLLYGEDIAMPIPVTGHDRVRRLQEALGGSPPAGAEERAVSSINQFRSERRERQRGLTQEQEVIQREAPNFFATDSG